MPIIKVVFQNYNFLFIARFLAININKIIRNRHIVKAIHIVRIEFKIIYKENKRE